MAMYPSARGPFCTPFTSREHLSVAVGSSRTHGLSGSFPYIEIQTVELSVEKWEIPG